MKGEETGRLAGLAGGEGGGALTSGGTAQPANTRHLLNLPTDRPRQAVQDPATGTVSLALSVPSPKKLEAVGTLERVSLRALALAALETLIYRYTGQEEFVVTCVSAVGGGAGADAEGALQLLHVQAAVNGGLSLIELARRIERQFADSQTPEATPSDPRAQTPGAAHGASSAWPGQVVLAFEDTDSAEIHLPGRLSREALNGGPAPAPPDLVLHLRVQADGLRASAEYNAHLFDAATISRLLGHFETLLAAVASRPGLTTAEAPLLTEAEHHQLIHALNETRADFPGDACLHQLFETQAGLRPEADAVLCGETSLSYAELNRRANRLAHHLRGLGVGVGATVGLCVRRSVEMVVGIVGILKAGAAYIPLDPDYPQDRLTFMLRDTKTSVLVGESDAIETLPLEYVSHAVRVDADADAIARQKAENPASGVGTENLAYVIYTSGSTGVPKGIAIRHRGVVNNITDLNRRFGVDSQDRLLAISSLSFDMCVYEVLGALAAGAGIVLPTRGQERDPAHWVELIERHAVTVWNSAPSLLEMLVEQARGLSGSRPLSFIRLALLGGDWVEVTLPERLREAAGRRVEVVVMGGATESSIHSTIYCVGERDPGWRSIPYGRPMANQQVYVLDEWRQPVPSGVPGELYLGGVGLAWGYFNRPALTAEKFVPHPFGPTPGERLYRTGDLVRHRPDGELELLGRMDFQVKLRGLRVELGEVTSALKEHPSVEDAVVIAREDEPGDKRLAAYLVADPQSPAVDARALTKSLRGFLREKLPEYMIPSAFVPLKALPLTPNGKVDRRALPRPQPLHLSSADPAARPHTPVQELLAGIWAEALGLAPDALGVDDDFFELGGHSLLATRAASRIRSAFGVEVPLRAIFRHPTVAALAEFVEREGSPGRQASAPPLPAGPRAEAEPLSFAQQRLWFFDQMQPGNPFYNIPVTMRLTGELDVEALERSFGEIVRRHEALRTTFVSTDGQPAQVIGAHRPVRIPVVDLSGMPADEQGRAVRLLSDEEARAPFNLSEGPLLRVRLLRLAADEHELLLTIHHIVSDGWSTGVLVRELTAFYGAFRRGEAVSLPEPPIQYADFARWQREWLSGEVLDAQLSYWRRQLVGAATVLELPSDHPRPPVQSYRGAPVEFSLPAELTRRLKLLSRQAGTTLFMTLLAAFDVLLWRYTGQEDVLVGVPVANRNRAELEPLIGFFVNTLVLRADLSGEPTFLELLGRVRESALEAYANQDLPLERLVEELQAGRDPGRNPLFQVMFVFENAPLDALRLPGLSLGAADFNNAVGARTDVDFYLWETPEGLGCRFIYNVDIFEAETVRRLGERFRLLAESIAQDPAATISGLRVGRETELPPIQAGGVGVREAPLSYHQERLWFIEQFETGNVYASSPTYHNLPLILRLDGPVDTGVLEDSLQSLVERHAALRTGIVTAGDRAFQSVNPRAAPKLEVPDLSPDGERAAEDSLLEAALAVAGRPIDLERGLPLRAALLRAGGDRAMLVVSIHHALADRRTLRIIGEELAEVYTARQTGRAPRLPEVKLTYADYVAWQRNLPAEALEELLLYWRWQLRGRLQALELPEDRPRPAVHTYTPASCRFSLGEELTARINALAEGERADAFAVLLAAFKALLHGYTRQDEIVVGTSVACRNRPGTEHVVGPLANLLVLRTGVQGDLSFASLLRRVGDTVGRALAHQEMPFDRLVQELKPEKDMSRTALFDVLFQFEGDEAPALEFGHARAQVIETNRGHGKYDLNLSVRGGRSGFDGTLVYNADIYDAETIDQLARHFRVMLEAVTSAPERKIGEVILLSEAEERQQLIAWNSTAAAYPADKTVHELFEEQARRTPEQTAVVCGASRLSYRELDEQANRLAHRLRAQGVCPDTLVALCLDKSPEMISALLAVLKAGGAYLPLEPSHPEERLRFMLADSGVSHLITTSSLLPRVPGAVPNTILLDVEREAIDSLSSAAPAAGDVTPGSLAYVIYTSGSTGKPKGVLIEHRNVVRLMTNERLPFSFTGADVWTMFHSYCFDFSVWEMYGALLYGGTLVVVPEQVMKDPSLFLGLLAREKVTVLNQTPTAFYNLSQEALAGPPVELSLRYVVFGGEALHPVRLREWRQAYPAVTLVNMYGITETTVHVTFKEVADREIEENVSNVGRPIPTTTTYVMGPDLRLLPVGVPGEVCVGGLGVSRGYLRRDELTRRRFVTNPYKPAERIYRSGDLAKLRRDGELIYLGRIDDQVQIRGFRVEPGEVRSRLLEHPAVFEAEVVAAKGRQEATELVAYVVPKNEASVAALRAHLTETLPYYMVPAAFVMLKALPVTPNGKVDRRALPAPDWGKISGVTAPLRPRTPVEELLAGIWAEVLGVEPERLGVGDNFFERGGHSLLATQVISRIRKVFALSLPVSVMFQTGTLARLAESIEAGIRAGQTVQGLTIRPAPRGETAPLSFGQQRLWFLDQLQPGNPFYNIPVAMRLSGRLDVETLAESLNQVVSRHESLRASFVTRDGAPVQLIAASARVPLNVVDLGHLPGAEREAEARRLIREEALVAFDLGAGPLLRVKLLRLAADEHVLLLTMHHIVSDGWSAGILVNDWTAIYGALLEGKASPLPPLGVQYTDFARWQREWLSGEVLDAQLSYWKRRLAGAPPILELPTDRPRPRVQTFRGARIYFEVEEQTVRRLRKSGQANGATLYMVLLAALNVVLGRHTGQEDVLVGTPIANRGHAEVEDVIGFFVNTLVLRTDLSGEPTFSELTRRVREVALEAYTNQDVPFERLVEELSPKRDLGRNPIFDVMFALHTPAGAGASLPGASLSLIPFDEGTTQFDLSVVLNEAGEGLSGDITYSTDLFGEATMRRLAGHYLRVLEQVAEDPDRRVGDLELMAPGELQLLDEWNRTSAPYPAGSCAHELFEEQSRRTPEAAAVACEGRALTYAELDSRANQLAHHLRRLGVRPEVRVGVLLERSVESAVTLLAILKAGGVYVPLSPDYPAERIEWVVKDSGAKVVLTQETLLEKLVGGEARAVCVDTDARDVGEHSASALEPLAAPANVAYMIYTSGSTGRPKGVMVEHASLVNTLAYGRRAFALTPEDVAGVIASFSFDISLLELMTSWLAGSCSLILGREEILNMELLARRLEQSTVFLAVPSFMRHIVDSLRGREARRDFGGVKRVLTGGELIPPHILKDIEETFHASVTNVLYGPTETTLICADQEIARGSDVRKPLVGKAIANTQIHMLDRRMRLVPIGVRGELYIGGAGLARGYMNRPGLTAERFVPDPFGTTPGARLYRTGDVGRYQPDGSIEFVGRTDQQVKIRGYRIEPAEIDGVLAEHPDVSAAVTVTRRDADGEFYLASYVVLDSTDAGTGELWEWLRVKLPAYMLPRSLRRIEKIPTTRNGKVDRDALPDSPPEDAGAGASYVPARSPVEQKIAALWAEVLQVGRVGVRDNFFDLGGHSLLLARLRDSIHAELGSKLSMVDMFTFTTVEALAQRLSEAGDESRGTPGDGAPERLAAGRQRAGKLRKRRVETEGASDV